MWSFKKCELYHWMHFFSAGPKKILGAKKRFTSGENGQLRAFYFFFIVLPNVDFDTSTDLKIYTYYWKTQKKTYVLDLSFSV